MLQEAKQMIDNAKEQQKKTRRLQLEGLIEGALMLARTGDCANTTHQLAMSVGKSQIEYKNMTGNYYTPFQGSQYI